MDIQHVVQQCLPWRSSQTVAEIDAEIREELEFHLNMRAEDNLRAGMSPEEANKDAQFRFGDFEANRRACRKITLGPRLMLRRLQAGLFLLLIGAVIYQSVLLFNLQAASRQQIESLTQQVEQLQTARQPARDEAALIPYVHWTREMPRGSVTAHDGANADVLADWSTIDGSLDQPWSDWGSLDDESETY